MASVKEGRRDMGKGGGGGLLGVECHWEEKRCNGKGGTERGQWEERRSKGEWLDGVREMRKGWQKDKWGECAAWERGE